MNTIKINSVNEFKVDESMASSPFRYESGSNIRRQLLRTGISAAALMNDPVNTAILGAANRLQCSTEYQVTDLLNGMGMKCKYSDVRNRMFQMAGTGLLDHYRYDTDGHAYTHSFFTIGTSGRVFMRSLGKTAAELPYDAEGESAKVLKLLSANQYLTKAGVSAADFETAVKIHVRGDTYRAFRPQAVFTSAEGATIFIECIRREPNWQTALAKKFMRADAALSSGKPMNIPVSSPVMLFIAEDSAHCREIMELIGREKFAFHMLFTADDLVYNHPQLCLYELTGGFMGLFRGIAAQLRERKSGV